MKVERKATKSYFLYISNMSRYRVKADKCVKCDRSFEVVYYHSSDMCRNCYNINWSKKRRESKVPKEQAKDHCESCLAKWGSLNKKGKEVYLASKGMCRPCYQKYYNRTRSSCCKRCNRDMSKKIKGVCSLCKIELETIKAPGRRNLPTFSKVSMDRETREVLRRVLNRYKFGLNTLVDPFIVTNLYLEVFSDDNIKGRTASKTEFNLDQFDQENQVIAMLKLLKIAYDKSLV